MWSVGLNVMDEANYLHPKLGISFSNYTFVNDSWGCTYEVPLVRRRELENVHTAARLRNTYETGIGRE
jgi:hypothetical protein